MKMKDITIFNTNAHVTLVGILHDYCELLIREQFCDTNGSHAKLLLGAKGIGKSTVLSTFANYCKGYYQDIIPIYITFDSLTIKIIVRRLLEAGVIREEDKVQRADDIIKVLEEKEKFMLLLVDEIDQLYRVHSPELTRIGHFDLGALNWLGDQKSGRVVVLLCGSSASCPLLVTCHADAKEFPLQVGAPSLNGTKYKTERIPTEPFTNLDQIPHIFPYSPGDLVDKKLSRLISFSVGVNPRAVNDFVMDLVKNNPNKDIYQMMKTSNHESGLALVNSNSYLLYRKLIQKLYAKNQELIKQLLTNDELSIQKVMDIEWEREFLPLDYADIISVWDSLLTNDGQRVLLSQFDLQFALFELSDRGQLTFNEIKNGLPDKVYPMNLSQVFLEFNEPHCSMSFKNNLNTHFYHLGLEIKQAILQSAPNKAIEKVSKKL